MEKPGPQEQENNKIRLNVLIQSFEEKQINK
jgi:hypothetical protein